MRRLQKGVIVKKHDLIIYIHGVSPDEDLVTVTEKTISGEERPPSQRSGHQEDYEFLSRGVGEQISNTTRKEAWQKAIHCHTEWGWEHEETDAQIGASHRLIDAQYHLGKRTIRKMKRPWVWGSLLSPLRKIELYGLSDVFYYVTTDGRRSVRDRIADQIGKSLGALLDDPGAHVSFTLIGHSAGSVIAFDIVTSLLTDEQSFMETLDSLAEKEAQLESRLEKLNELFSGKPVLKGPAGVEDTLGVTQRRRKLLAGIQEKRFTLRRLFTLGSPITMLALRSDEDVRSLAYGQPMSLDRLGLALENSGTVGQPESLRWANIWDVRDPISFPVESLVEESPVVKDFHVKTTVNFLKSHTAYWTSRKVHKVIGTQW